MKRRISPTALTLAWFRKRGIAARVTERWVKTPAGGFRRDIFGGDLLALLRTEIVNVQAGSGAHHAEKIRKAVAHPDVRKWLTAPTRKFWIMTWTQRAAFNKSGARRKKDRWTPRVTTLSLVAGKILANDFHLSPSSAPKMHHTATVTSAKIQSR